MKIIFILFCLINIGNKIYAQSDLKNSIDTTITIKVKGVTCKNDLTTLADNVKSLSGVVDCKPGKMGPVSQFKITYNTTLVATSAIFKAIENTAGCSDPNERPYKIKN